MVNTLLTIEDVAKQLGVSVATVRSWVMDRKITYRKVGRYAFVSCNRTLIR